MSKKETITVQGTEITILSEKNNDYISLTDMAGYKDNLEARIVVSNWMSTYYTVDFLAIWEQVNKLNSNRMGFHTVRNKDIAFEFASWISAEFELYLVKITPDITLFLPYSNNKTTLVAAVMDYLVLPKPYYLIKIFDTFAKN
jgi:hypothetical protein